MIEAPEARYLCEQLTETVVGKRISDVFIQFSPHKFAWFNGNSDEFAEWLVDKRINSAQSQGGMVEITIEDKVLVLTDGVNLRYLTPGTKLPAKHQLLIAFEDESCLIASVRMYGGIMCYSKDAANGVLSEYYRTAKSKPQVMSDAFSKEYFLGLINDESAQKKSAKAFLAGKRCITGHSVSCPHPSEEKNSSINGQRERKFVLSSKGNHERYLPAGWTKHGIGPVRRKWQVYSLPL